jgi:hypothetical protein
MASQIVKHSNFSASNITFRPPKSLNNGGKMVYVAYDGGILNLQTPMMVLPYGISEFEDPNTGMKKYHIDLSFRGEDENEQLAQFHRALAELDEFMVNSAVKNSMTWFKGKKPRAVLEELYAPVLKKSKDKETGEPNGKYPDTFKVKLQYDNESGEFKCELFDNDTKQAVNVPPDVHLSKGTRMKCLIACSGVWFAGGRFGLSFRLIQAKVKVPPGRISGYSFLDDDEDDVVETNPTTTTPKEDNVEAEENSDVDVSDGEDADNSDSEEERSETPVAPEPAPKKKVTRRRRTKNVSAQSAAGH